ncbi:hypothetical protein [Acidisphaera sp. L21]|uniref:hypothetical protein n=1 Tax=Acidisphaera sp. L21 TaxID=1641851 RepID=UPI00131C9466|nr:hypothetical protein [Acidisphaera sp. L21]
MSIGALEAALLANATASLAVVSEKLFYRLDQLDRVLIEQVKIPMSEVALGNGVVRRFFRGLVQTTQQPITFTYFVLAGERRVRIELAALWDLRMDDDGPRSFRLASLVAPDPASPPIILS